MDPPLSFRIISRRNSGQERYLHWHQNVASNFDEIHFPIDAILPFEDPDKIAVKFKGNLHLQNGKDTYENDYLAILTFNEQGKITEWIEYYNPITATNAFGLMDKIR